MKYVKGGKAITITLPSPTPGREIVIKKTWTGACPIVIQAPTNQVVIPNGKAGQILKSNSQGAPAWIDSFELMDNEKFEYELKNGSSDPVDYRGLPFHSTEKSSGCDHAPKRYVGFREEYDYCTKCNEKLS